MSIKVPVSVELADEAQLGKILELVDGDAPPANKVDAFVNELIGQVIAGAMVLPADAVDKLLEIDPELDSAERIIELVESGSGQANGEFVIRWPIDPALTQPMRDRAETNGVSVQQLIREMMDSATALGYFYDLANDLRVVFLTREDEREASEIFGTPDFTSKDVMAAIRASKFVEPEKGEEEIEDDPFASDEQQVPITVTE